MAKNDFDELMSVGIDIGKDIFHLVGFDRDGHLVLRKKIKRLALEATFESLPRCVVGMEACMSAHFVSRALRELGFEPRIIPAICVKPFNKGQKNDYNDAEAVAEAARLAVSLSSFGLTCAPSSLQLGAEPLGLNLWP